MISVTAEYALRAVVVLAQSAGTPLTARDVAEAGSLPRDYTAKVLGDLAQAGIVHGRRGIGGGYTLLRAPNDLTALEVVNAVDPIRRIERCPLDRPDHEELCPLHKRIDRVAADAQAAFAKTRISDLLDEQGRALCEED